MLNIIDLNGSSSVLVNICHLEFFLELHMHLFHFDKIFCTDVKNEVKMELRLEEFETGNQEDTKPFQFPNS